MGATSNFFKTKQVWSEVKDELLRTYLAPYLAKVATKRSPIILVDCFAGKGRFDDGKEGSPLIFLDATRKQQDNPRNCSSFSLVLIEKKYAEELRRNVPKENWIYILDGDYEERMKSFINEYEAMGKNLFLYVDPYGIKSILFSHFKEVCGKGADTVELLLNLNAFGFLREGCRLLGKKLASELEESLEYEADVSSSARLDEIAGGDYWRDIITDYYESRLVMAKAEELFAKQYCEKLKTLFRYVINIPIKAKLSNIPKYRIVFGTNHEDGLLLMAENMKKRWEELKTISRGNESYLFEFDFPESDGEEVHWNLENALLPMIKDGIELKNLLVDLVMKYGISPSVIEYKKCLMKLEKDERIEVYRFPGLTPKGKTSRSWEHMGNKITIKLWRKEPCQQNLL